MPRTIATKLFLAGILPVVLGIGFTGCRAPSEFDPLTPYGAVRIPPPSTGAIGSTARTYDPGLSTASRTSAFGVPSNQRPNLGSDGYRSAAEDRGWNSQSPHAPRPSTAPMSSPTAAPNNSSPLPIPNVPPAGQPAPSAAPQFTPPSSSPPPVSAPSSPGRLSDTNARLGTPNPIASAPAANPAGWPSNAGSSPTSFAQPAQYSENLNWLDPRQRFGQSAQTFRSPPSSNDLVSNSGQGVAGLPTSTTLGTVPEAAPRLANRAAVRPRMRSGPATALNTPPARRSAPMGNSVAGRSSTMAATDGFQESDPLRDFSRFEPLPAAPAASSLAADSSPYVETTPPVATEARRSSPPRIRLPGLSQSTSSYTNRF